MNITSGLYKGHKIKSPHDEKIHPMGERERLALFNIIGNDLSGKTVLDTFAGSGALGLESLSRGAKKVVFVDNAKNAIKTIAENLHSLPNLDKNRYFIEKSSLKNFKTSDTFSLIFADPPYDAPENFTPDALAIFSGLLLSDGLFVLSHPDSAPLIPGLKLIKTKSYARAHLSFYVIPATKPPFHETDLNVSNF